MYFSFQQEGSWQWVIQQRLKHSVFKVQRESPYDDIIPFFLTITTFFKLLQACIKAFVTCCRSRKTNRKYRDLYTPQKQFLSLHLIHFSFLTTSTLIFSLTIVIIKVVEVRLSTTLCGLKQVCDWSSSTCFFFMPLLCSL